MRSWTALTCADLSGERTGCAAALATGAWAGEMESTGAGDRLRAATGCCCCCCFGGVGGGGVETALSDEGIDTDALAL